MKISHFCLMGGLLLSTLSGVKAGDTPRSTVSPVQRSCGTPQLPDEFEHWLSSQRINQNRPLGVQYTIPVVVHIVHNGQEVGVGPNISYAQIMSQINVLNQDYNKTNADTSRIPAAFKPLSSSVGITFCPAVVDPNGNVLDEPGVHRVNRSTLSLTVPPWSQTYVDATIKPLTIWDPNEYLNIWVMPFSDETLLGYATFPNPGTSGVGGITSYGDLVSDGVVISYQAFGTGGQAIPPFNRGRTTTHEVGHWLGLRHIWGDAVCGNDYVNDTPTQREANYNCPGFPHITCTNGPNGDMFMNFMDYTDDTCMYMFTAGQQDRVEAILNGSPFRKNAILSTACNIPNAVDAKLTIVEPGAGDSVCASSFVPYVKIINHGSSALTSFTLQVQLDGGAVQSYPWTGSLAFSNSIVFSFPAINIPSVGNHTFTANVINPNGTTDGTPANNTQTVSFKRVNPTPSTITLPYLEGFQTATFPPTGWKYTIPDPVYRWRRFTAAGGFGQSTASIRMDNFNSLTNMSGQRDILETPPFDFSAANSTLRIRFDVAYARYNQFTNDSLNLYISTDCGLSWTRIYTKGGTNLATAPDITTEFIPTAGQWRKDSVSLSAYAGQSSVLFRIESRSGWGNFLYLDNINVLQTATAFAPVANFTLSTDTICAGESVTLTDASQNSPTSWAWTLTGGTPPSSTAQNPQVTYTSAGTKTITLVATNATGSSAPVSKTVVVLPLPAVPTITKNGDTLRSSFATGNQWYRNNVLIGGATNQTYIVTQTGNYTVKHTAANGCSATSTVTTVTSVGIADHIAKDFSFEVTPNPNNGVFTISLNTRKTGDFKLEIRNVLGQVIADKMLDKVSQQYSEVFDLQNYGKGVYFISLENEGKILTRKVLVD